MKRVFLMVLLPIFIGCVNNEKKSKEYIKQVDVSTLMNAEEIQLRNLFSAGAIGLSEYNDIQQYKRKQFEDKIRFSDFSSKEIYATEEGITKSESLMKIDDMHKKNDLQEFIIYASQNDRLIYCLAAYSQGDTNLLTGTLFTISPKYNEKGRIKGKMNQGRQIFIPDF